MRRFHFFLCWLLVALVFISAAFPSRVIAADTQNDPIDSIIRSLNCQIVGCNGQDGAVDVFVGSIGFMLSVHPASSRDFIGDAISRLRIPGTPITTYAAEGGVGFESLAPVLRIWTVARNLAYLILAALFVVVGLMIVLRVKVDPKTVVTIQSALPKFVWVLILITFSYAIAGFVIDLMYLSLNIIVMLIGNIGGVGAEKKIEELIGGSIFDFVFKGFWWDVTTNTSAAVGLVLDQMLQAIKLGVLGNLLSLLLSGLAGLIIGIAILWALVRTWLMLIGAYANLILAIIFSPLQLMLDAIPGQNQFNNWLRTLLAYALSFPAVVLMLTIAAAIATNFGQGQGRVTGGFVPPLLGVGDPGAALAFVGLGILLTIPKTLEILQEALKTPPFKHGTAWGEAVGAGMGLSAAGYRTGGNFFFGSAADRYRADLEASTKTPSLPAPRRFSVGGISSTLGFSKKGK